MPIAVDMRVHWAWRDKYNLQIVAFGCTVQESGLVCLLLAFRKTGQCRGMYRVLCNVCLPQGAQADSDL